MNSKKTRICIILLALLASCADNKEHSCPILDVSSPQEATPSEVFSSVEVIPFTMPEGTYMSDVRTLFSIGDKYIVKDKNNIVYLFSTDGRYISHSGKVRGHGHGEYTILMGFTYNPYSKQIELTTPNDLLFYDTLFNYVKSVPLPSKWPKGSEGSLFYDKIYDLSSSLHVLEPTGPSEEARQKICIFDSEKGEIIKNIPYIEHCIVKIAMQAKSFYTGRDGQILFIPPCISECLYTFDTKSLTITPCLSLDFGTKWFDAEEIREMRSKGQDLLEYEKGMPMTYLPLGDNLIIEVTFGKYIRNCKTLVVNTTSGKHYLIKRYQQGQKMVLPHLSEACPDGVLGVVEAKELESLLEQFDEKDVIMPSRPIDPDGYVILKYRMK